MCYYKNSFFRKLSIFVVQTCHSIRKKSRLEKYFIASFFFIIYAVEVRRIPEYPDYVKAKGDIRE